MIRGVAVTIAPMDAIRLLKGIIEMTDGGYEYVAPGEKPPHGEPLEQGPRGGRRYIPGGQPSAVQKPVKKGPIDIARMFTEGRNPRMQPDPQWMLTSKQAKWLKDVMDRSKKFGGSVGKGVLYELEDDDGHMPFSVMFMDNGAAILHGHDHEKPEREKPEQPKSEEPGKTTPYDQVRNILRGDRGQLYRNTLHWKLDPKWTGVLRDYLTARGIDIDAVTGRAYVPPEGAGKYDGYLVDFYDDTARVSHTFDRSHS
jgi:hypothetical protein